MKTDVLTPALEGQIGRELARALSESAQSLPNHTLERLRVARESALRVQRPELSLSKRWASSSPSGVVLGGESGNPRGPWWAYCLPMIAVAMGLYLIEVAHQDAQVSAAADVDAQILADDLPPDAYTDAGFLEFLKLE